MRLEFIYPWLLLLLIPAFLITLLPHFRLVKRFRRTRNRIIPLIMRIIVFVFAITTLAGVTISYTVANNGNEIILLVDVSDGITSRYQNVREDCIANIVYGMENDLDGAKLGIVTFGYDQKYVAPLNSRVSDAHNQYVTADETPDTSATNIAGALKFAKGLFSEEATWKKIIVITDGKETDEVALSVIRQIIAEDDKICVDVVDLQAQYEDPDAQVVGITMPSYRVASNQDCEIKIAVQSNRTGMVLKLSLFDNDVSSVANGSKGYQEFVSSGGLQEITFTHVFAEGGLHSLKAVLEETESSYDKNNTYISYYNIEIFDDILIIEGVEHDSDVLKEMLTQDDVTSDGKYNVTVLSVPTLTYEVAGPIFNMDALRQYDQIILNNVSNADLLKIDQILYEGLYPAPTPEDKTLDEFKNTTVGLLYDYVYEYGGGLFTIGGDDVDGSQHSYDIEDLQFTQYAQLLPVQVVDYTPPTGVVVIIDRSGSMHGEKLSAARQGAYAVLDALTERDYMCIMTLDNNYYTVLEMTSVRFKDKIRAAIDSIDKSTNGTIYSHAIQRAGQTLAAMDYIQKRHIIMVTDSEPADKPEEYLGFVRQFYQNNGTTISMAVVGGNAGPKAKAICEAAGGPSKGSNWYSVTNLSEFGEKLRGDISNPSIKELEPEEFNPNMTNMMSPLTSGFDSLTDFPNKMIATLGGFYGVRARNDANAEVILTANYDVPLYAQWTRGKGRVGSFTSDLKGTSDSWSENFLADKDGKQFILNVISNLMPTSSIRPLELSATLDEDNYTNTITVFNTLEKGEYIKGDIYKIGVDGTETHVLSLNQKVGEDVDLSAEQCYVTINFTQNAEENNSKYCTFVLKTSGVYRIDLVKYDAAGLPTDVVRSYYKSFAYSEEYDVFSDETTVKQLRDDLTALAQRGEGGYVTDIEDTSVLLNAEDTIVKVYDPRILFMILTIIMMLIDIAVRKFKFKWPHELIREYRQKQQFVGKK